MRLVFLFLLCLIAPAVAGAQTRADMQCKSAGKELIYNCVIRLARAEIGGPERRVNVQDLQRRE